MDSGSEREILSSNSSRVLCRRLCANTLGSDVNLSLLPKYGLNSRTALAF